MFLINRSAWEDALTGGDGELEAGGEQSPEAGPHPFPLALNRLETAVLDACAGADEWPAQVAAAIYAGVDFAIENPAAAGELTMEAAARAGDISQYERVIGRLAGFIRVNAPIESRLPVSTDEAVVAGIVGLVGDHVRAGRVKRLSQLRPELVLLALLPYLGFEDAQSWANRMPQSRKR